MPAMSPAMMTFRYRIASTRMPTVSAATGCSPIARVRSPHRVRNSPTCTTISSDVGDVQEDDRVEEDRPDDRDVAEQRDLHRVEGAGLFSVSPYGTMIALYR